MDFKEYSTEQLELQYSAINQARFLLERGYNASESTIDEIFAIMKTIQKEIDRRR